MSVVAPLLPVDPLIAEAKSRARRRRLLALGLVVVAAAVAVVVPLATRSSPAKPPISQAGPAARDRVPIWNVGVVGGVTWAFGGRRAWLTSNGKTWRLLPVSVKKVIAPDPLSTVQFVDSRDGWVLDGHDRIERTTDGGRSWQLLPPLPAGVGRSVAGFSFLSKTVGYLSAWMHGPVQFTTQDGGMTWHLSNARRGFPDGTHTVWIPTEGGRSSRVLLRVPWNSELFRPTVFGRRLVAASLVVGNPYGDRLVVYRSGDGGRTWTTRDAPGLFPGRVDGGSPTVGFTALTPTKWVAQSASSILITLDAGRTWRKTKPVNIPRSWADSVGAFTSLRDGWGLFETPPPRSTRPSLAPASPSWILMRTTDGGRHWTPAGPLKQRRH